MAGQPRRVAAPRRRTAPPPWLGVLATVVIVAGCAGTSTTAPSAGPPSTGPSGATAPSPGGPASPGVAPSPGAPAGITPGATVITVTDDLRVRSEPRVADESVKYTPLLPEGTELRVLEGPVPASGYQWYRVELIESSLDGGVDSGWIAAGDHGVAWIEPSEATLAMASVPRRTVDPKAARQAADSIGAFGLDLYRGILADPRLALGTKNVVLSPASVALALGMVRPGARGATADQMDAAMHTQGWDAFSSGIASLDQLLAARNATWIEPQDYEPGKEHGLALRIANAAFAREGWPIEPAYLDDIGATFGAGVRQLDFAGDADGARKVINDWIARKTEGRIPRMLGEGTPNEATMLLLANAVYLKAEWLSVFSEGQTEPSAFRRLDGSTVKVPTMHQQATWPYATGKGWQAVEIPYRSADWEAQPDQLRWFTTDTVYPALTMTLILPGDLRAFEKGLTSSQLDGIAGALAKQRSVAGSTIPAANPEPDSCGLHPYDVDVAMPRFGIETKASLVETLKHLGMHDLFADADLSGMGPGAAGVSAVLHQANIDVDEKGTTAAAATVVDVSGGCTGTEPAKVIPFKLDRPFLFLIRDTETGAILFMGRVVDPSTRS